METEDIPYTAPGFATPDDDKKPDDDQANKSILQDIVKYLTEQIKKHNSLDLVDPNAEIVMNTQQQVVVQKEIVTHLRNIRTEVINKIKELV